MTTPIFITTGGAGNKNGVISARTGAATTLLRYTTGAGPILGIQLTQDTLPTSQPISDLLMWGLDFSNPSSLYNNPQFPLSSGILNFSGPIGAAILDHDKNRMMVAFAPSSGQRMQLIPNAINGRAAASGDGVDDCLLLRVGGALLNNNSSRIFVVAKSSDWATIATSDSVFLSISDANSTIRFLDVGVYGTEIVPNIVFGNSRIRYGSTILVNNNAYIMEYASIPTSSGTLKYEIVVNGTTQNIDSESFGPNDGAWYSKVGTNLVGQATGILTQVTDYLTIGARVTTDISTPVVSNNAMLGEIRMYRNLSTAQSLVVRSELATKWGITLHS